MWETSGPLLVVLTYYLGASKEWFRRHDGIRM